ncbi:hypothetical protein FLL57_17660 [Rhodopseudomonas palustris]|uniref:hypothetical protein n=1 Tax=Rhodopseudomonas palustris TaxID=1076 RepID=UPI00115F1874|nr:hypothetical protein [Rhodopseudomonas palustris]QDL99018.1 hypothetical protein FLL57_17660 [Rhodopseudomonas palustris]
MRSVVPAKDSLTISQLSRYELQIARGVSLDAYSAFEQILMEVFAHLIGANMKLGGIVFFRLTNSGLRQKILEDLIDAKFGKQYDQYWHGTPKQAGLFGLIRQLEQRRNEIVHWKAVGLTSKMEFGLVAPNIWSGRKGSSIFIDDVYEFIAKADCLRHYAGNFNWWTVRRKEDEPLPEKFVPWRDIFSRPPSYPPSQDHPLFPVWKAPQNRRLSLRPKL